MKACTKPLSETFWVFEVNGDTFANETLYESDGHLNATWMNFPGFLKGVWYL